MLKMKTKVKSKLDTKEMVLTGMKMVKMKDHTTAAMKTSCLMMRW